MVSRIFGELAHVMSPNEIVKAWGGKAGRAAIAESVALARRSLFDQHGRLRNPKELLSAA